MKKLLIINIITILLAILTIIFMFRDSFEDYDYDTEVTTIYSMFSIIKRDIPVINSVVVTTFLPTLGCLLIIIGSIIGFIPVKEKFSSKYFMISLMFYLGTIILCVSPLLLKIIASNDVGFRYDKGDIIFFKRTYEYLPNYYFMLLSSSLGGFINIITAGALRDKKRGI